MLNPTTEQKQKQLIGLTTVVYQHAGCHVSPTWFDGSEDDDYRGESYNIGWENDNYLAEISYGYDPKLIKNDGEYGYWIFVMDLKNNHNYTISEFVKDDEPYNLLKNSKFKEFIKFINDNFKKDSK